MKLFDFDIWFPCCLNWFDSYFVSVELKSLRIYW